MGIASKYNKNQKLFSYKMPDEPHYRKLEDFFRESEDGKPDQLNTNVFPVEAMYINKKSNYGESPVICFGDNVINCPKHLLETVEEIRADQEAVDQINAGMLGFRVYQYLDTKHNRTCYSLNWVDLDTLPASK